MFLNVTLAWTSQFIPTEDYEKEMQDPSHRFSRQLSSAASSSSPSASGMARREIARPESAHSEIRSALAFTRSQNSTSSRFGSQSGLSTRSEERRVGKEGVSTFRYRWS